MADQGIPLILSLLLSMTCFLVVPSSSQTHNGPLTDNKYLYHQQLNDDYNLKWKFNSTHIQFHIKVKTLGYIGFGLSGHGGMYPGDMVIVWMAGETVHFHDRHAISEVMPIVDEQQDWHLLDFQWEDDECSSFTVVRKLNTCDKEGDISIEKGTTRVIYSYSDNVPASDNSIPYHGPNTRGTKSILLLDPPPKEDDGNNMADDGVFSYDLSNNNYPVPGQDTTYSCLTIKLEGLNEKVHMIGYEPVIQKGHEKLVHHMIMYACQDPVPDKWINKYYECYDIHPVGIAGNCETVWFAWGIGGLGFNYPANVGQSLGTPEDPAYIVLETHYDNVEMKSDYVDSSGIRLFLTTKLRTYDAGLLTVGSVVDYTQVIPPGIPDFLTSGSCPASCIENGLGDGYINIFGDFLHSHLIGRRMAARHVRDGRELPPIVKDDHYDFNYQEMRALAEERIVFKGDILITDCYYDSTSRVNVTYGGFPSTKEMCLSFLLYYPRMNLTSCFTRVNYAKNSKPMYTDFDPDKMDWSKAKIREEFAQNVLNSDVIDFCSYTSEIEPNPATRPLEFVEYVPEDVCQPSGGMCSSIPNGVLGFLMFLVCLIMCNHNVRH